MLMAITEHDGGFKKKLVTLLPAPFHVMGIFSKAPVLRV